MSKRIITNSLSLASSPGRTIHRGPLHLIHSDRNASLQQHPYIMEELETPPSPLQTLVASAGVRNMITQYHYRQRQADYESMPGLEALLHLNPPHRLGSLVIDDPRLPELVGVKAQVASTSGSDLAEITIGLQPDLDDKFRYDLIFYNVQCGERNATSKTVKKFRKLTSEAKDEWREYAPEITAHVPTSELFVATNILAAACGMPPLVSLLLPLPQQDAIIRQMGNTVLPAEKV